MANGVSASGASILDTLSNSVVGLEDAMGRLNESMLNDPAPTGLTEAKTPGSCSSSRKLNALRDLIQRIDYVTASLNQASSDLYKL